MKKLKLRKWVKVVLSILIIGASLFIYLKIGTLGQFVNKNILIDMLIIGGWFWLIFGQILFLMNIWEN